MSQGRIRCPAGRSDPAPDLLPGRVDVLPGDAALLVNRAPSPVISSIVTTAS